MNLAILTFLSCTWFSTMVLPWPRKYSNLLIPSLNLGENLNNLQWYLLAFLDYKMEFFRDFHLGWKKMQTRKRKLPLSKQQLSLGNYEIVWKQHWGGWWHSFKLRQKEGWISRKFIFSEGKRYLSLTDVVRNWLLLPILPTYTNIWQLKRKIEFLFQSTK